MKSKEDQAQQIMQMLAKGAYDQYNYINTINEYMIINADDNEKSFFDI